MDLTHYNISWTSDRDGPGRRLVLFLQGCHLKCPWCHAPQSQPQRSPLLFFPSLCSNCGACEKICSNKVHRITGLGHQLDRSRCQQCGACCKACLHSSKGLTANGPLQLPTTRTPVDQLFSRLRPQLNLLKTLGGITVSGGEPLLQSEAVAALFKYCREEGIHTAIETSGTLDIAYMKPLADCTDLVLFGFRLTQKPYCIDSDLLNTTEQMLDYLRSENGIDLLARIPRIPTYTDFREYQKTVNRLIRKYRINQVERMELNPETQHYYQAAGMCYTGPKPGGIQNTRLAER